MKAYRLSRASPKKSQYEFVAKHMCSLPGVHCDACHQTWATTGLSYPSVTCDDLLECCNHLGPEIIPYSQFEAVKTKLISAFPHLPLVRPGTDFGPLTGFAKGYGDEIIWANPWTLLVTESLLEAFNQSGVDVTAVAADITMHDDNSKKLFEIEAPPLGSSTIESDILCEVCGRRGPVKSQEMEIIKWPAPEKFPIVRLRDQPSAFLVTEPFVRVLEKHRASGFVADPLPMRRG